MNKLFSKIATLSVGLAMAIGVGVALGHSGVPVNAADTTYTWTMANGDLGNTSTEAGSSGTKTVGGITWNYTRKLISGASYTGWSSDCIQLGKNGGVDNLTLSTTGFTGKIIEVGVECSSYNNNHKVAISVGGTTYLSPTATAKWVTVSTLTTGTISASGEIVIAFTNGTRALYIKSVTVKYNPTSKCNVTYDGNGNTSGTVPTDSTEYDQEASVTVKGNTGGLKKVGYVFDGWNTEADGTGTPYAADDTFNITLDTTLYAQWANDTVDHITVTGSMSKTTYVEGESWDPTGLSVNAYFADNPETPLDVTADVNLSWTYSPDRADETSITSVIATAYFGGKSASSSAQAVTVNESTEIKYQLNDVLTQQVTGVTGGSYENFENKTALSSAVYKGNCAGSNGAIQIRTNNSNSGVVTTASGGNVKKVVVAWEGHTQEGRQLDIYGKNVAYSEAADLFDLNKAGTLLGSIICGTSTELTITGNYTFVGFRSEDNAMYLASVTITWETIAEEEEINIANAFISANMHLDYTKNEGLCTTWYSTAKAAFNAITNVKAKSILLYSNSKYAKITLDPIHKKDDDPDAITYTYGDVRERLAAWAEANGETFNFVDGSFTNIRLNPLNYIGGDTSGYAIIIVVVTSAVLAFGLAIMLRKKHR